MLSPELASAIAALAVVIVTAITAAIATRGVKSSVERACYSACARDAQLARDNLDAPVTLSEPPPRNEKAAKGN